MVAVLEENDWSVNCQLKSITDELGDGSLSDISLHEHASCDLRGIFIKLVRFTVQHAVALCLHSNCCIIW